MSRFAFLWSMVYALGMDDNKTPRHLSPVPSTSEGERAAAQRRAYERLALTIRPEASRVIHNPAKEA